MVAWRGNKPSCMRVWSAHLRPTSRPESRAYTTTCATTHSMTFTSTSSLVLLLQSFMNVTEGTDNLSGPAECVRRARSGPHNNYIIAAAA